MIAQILMNKILIKNKNRRKTLMANFLYKIPTICQEKTISILLISHITRLSKFYKLFT